MPKPETEEFPYGHLCGWLGDGGHRPIAATMPKLIETNLARSATTAPTKNVLLYKCWTEVFSGDPDYPAQKIGDCVSFGHSHANDLLQTIEVYLGDLDRDAVHQTDTEFIYATSREVAGMLGRQDGSYGSAAVKAMTTIGMVSRAMLGSNGTYSGQRAKEWGWHGAPANVKAMAAAYKLGSAAQVTTWDELVTAISSGYPVTICSGQGFTLTRDSDGFCAARGHWGHCMFIAGIRFDRPGACVVQSWGPDSPSGPLALGQPSFSFWADRPVIERIVGEGDSWALSKTPGFAPRSLPAALSAA